MACVFCGFKSVRESLTNSHRCEKIFKEETYHFTKDRADAGSIKAHCKLCSNLLRCPIQCRNCENLYCSRCLHDCYQYLANKRCPNSKCQQRDDFVQPSTYLMSQLSLVSVKCSDCDKLVKYNDFDSHELIHYKCKLCAKPLTDWKMIAHHTYNECPKALIDCKNCIFKFSRKDYAAHSCKDHYYFRTAEICAFGITFFVIAVKGKLDHRLPVDECVSTYTLL